MIWWIIAAVVGWFIVTVGLALLIGGGIRIADRGPRPKAPKCRVDEEWCGVFIGRRYCSTHEVRWDGGGTCPRAGQPRRVGIEDGSR